METPPPPPPPTPPAVPPTAPPLSTPPSAPQPPRGWWSRNWKWFVPTGCLTLCLLFALFVCGILMIVFTAMKSSDVYKDALARAKANARVQHALGAHIHDAMFPSGSTSVNGPSGEAKLSIPISGSKGKGTIYLIATKSAGEWQYSKLVVKTEDGQAIDLMQESDSDDSTLDDDTT